MSRTIQEVTDGLVLEKQIKQTLIDQANATTGKEDTTLTDAVGSLVSGYGQGGSSGLNPLEYIAFADNLFNSVEFPSGSVFTVDLPNLKNASLNDCFNSTKGVKKIVVSGGFKNTATSVTFQRAFRQTEAEEIDLSGFNTNDITHLSGAFIQSPNLKRIICEFDFTNITNTTIDAFQYLYPLEEVRFVAKTIFKSITFANSPNLTDETIQSIIDGLADLTGQTAQTITFHADVKAKLTETQIATITNKNWTLVSK